MTQLLALTALFVSSYAVSVETGSATQADHRGLLIPSASRATWIRT